mmetsp:Transcript_14830/g.19564  ORF Transcript_14830/g.19564 Transcript_14830/m.19564 type:complete len:606 (+) Transcript_14830:243-2060(+)
MTLKRGLGALVQKEEFEDNLHLETDEVQLNKYRRITTDLDGLTSALLKNVCQEILKLSSEIPLDFKYIHADGSYFGGYRGPSPLYVIVSAGLIDHTCGTLSQLLSIVEPVQSEDFPTNREICGHDSCPFCERVITELEQTQTKVRKDMGLGVLFVACFCHWISQSGVTPSDAFVSGIVRWATMISWQQIQECESTEDLWHLIFANIQQYVEAKSSKEVRIFLQKATSTQARTCAHDLQVMLWSNFNPNFEMNIKSFLQKHLPAQEIAHIQWMKLQLHWMDSSKKVLHQGMKYLLRGTTENQEEMSGDLNDWSPLSARLDEWLSDLFSCKANSKYLENELLPELFLHQLLEIFTESDSLPSEEVFKSGQDIWGWQWLGIQDMAVKQVHPWISNLTGSMSLESRWHQGLESKRKIQKHYELLTHRYGNDANSIHAKLEKTASELDFICTMLKIFIYIQDLHCTFFDEGFEILLEKILEEILGEQMPNLKDFTLQVISKAGESIPGQLLENGTANQLIFEAILTTLVMHSGLFGWEQSEIEGLLSKFDLCSYAEAKEILTDPAKGIPNAVWKCRQPFLWISTNGTSKSAKSMNSLPDSIKSHIVQFII